MMGRRLRPVELAPAASGTTSGRAKGSTPVRGRRQPPGRIHLVSLGCPKNRVDSEMLLGMATEAGLEVTGDAADADVIVVNTCGFIAPAERESVDVTLEMVRHRTEGHCRLLVLAGCLVQRHAEELAAELPEVDHFIGPGDLPALRSVLEGRAARSIVGVAGAWLPSAADARWLAPRAGTAPRGAKAAPSAYLKIGDGCSRRCSFCVIPSLRGDGRSRLADDVVTEAEQLVAAGVRELCLVAQDTLAYGRDLPSEHRTAASRDPLAGLVARLGDIRGVRWVRLLYLYPELPSPALVELLAHHPQVAPYVDMPMQHVSDRMLTLMRRGHRSRRLRRIVERLREQVPGLTLRSTFIVGHPGETEADFAELRQFVRWAGFDRLGVFRYSDEPSTHSYRLPDKVPAAVVTRRFRSLNAIGRSISRRNNRALVGRTLDVLVEGPSDEHPDVLMGRHAGQAPEIDGQVYLSTAEGDCPDLEAGDVASAMVTQASDFDLVAVPKA